MSHISESKNEIYNNLKDIDNMIEEYYNKIEIDK